MALAGLVLVGGAVLVDSVSGIGTFGPREIDEPRQPPPAGPIGAPKGPPAGEPVVPVDQAAAMGSEDQLADSGEGFDPTGIDPTGLDPSPQDDSQGNVARQPEPVGVPVGAPVGPVVVGEPQ
ncbi:hypothetical protein [Parerythrobacter lacustris]|nr:hypothetical protein [Parerythrobacter lacustris]